MAASTRFAMAGKVFSWIVLAVLVLTLVLILRQSPAPDVGTSPTAAESAERKLDAAAQAASAGQLARVQLDNTELNSYLAQNLQLAGSDSADATSSGRAAANIPAVDGADPQTVQQAASTVESVKIDLNGDLLKTYVIFNLHGKDLSLEINGHLRTEDGYLKFDPVDGKFGSFPLPQSALQAAVQRMMDSPENREKLHLPPYISDVEVENGQMVIAYR